MKQNNIKNTQTEEDFLKDIEDITNTCLNAGQEMKILALLQVQKDNYERIKEDNAALLEALKSLKQIMEKDESIFKKELEIINSVI